MREDYSEFGTAWMGSYCLFMLKIALELAIWFPMNYLIIESLQKFYDYYGDDLEVQCPRGSGKMMNLWEVATELSQRLIRLFL